MIAGRATAQTAEGFALDRFEPAEVGSEWFAGDSLDFRGDQRWSFGVLGDWSYKPLVAYDAQGDETHAVVRHQIFAHLGAAVVLQERYRLALDVPILALERGRATTLDGVVYDPSNKAAFGDPRLAADVRFLGKYGGPLTASAGLAVYLPVGSQAAYASDGKLRLVPRLMAAGDVAWFTYAGRLSTNIRTQTDNFAGQPFGTEMQLEASAGVRTAEGKLVIGPELFGSTVLADGGKGAFDKRTTPFELLFGAHYRAGDWLLGAGAGPGLTRGFGAPKFRTLLSVAWAPEPKPEEPKVVKTAPPPPPPDSDGDGIIDSQDACPTVPGVKSDDPKKNGCPPDSDGDGIIDSQDACPTVPGVKSDDPKKNGCPPDSDGDGIIDSQDACPTVAGVKNDDPKKNGCPPDSDGDGIIDSQDACPTVAGVKNDDPRKNGCPIIELTDQAITILERVEFETGKAVLRPESDRVLSAVAGVMKEHPEILELSVEGHTDNRGGAALNRKLSRERAAAVKQWLIDHGIDAARLTSAGFGPDKPIASNKTDEGRQTNRRVEFRIVKSKGDVQVKDSASTKTHKEEK